MPETMRAFVMHGIDRVGTIEKPIPDPGPDDAIVKTTTALVCTSDTHTVHGAIDPTPMTTHRFPFDEVETAFRRMDSKEDGIIKPLVEFG
jgi:threonine dehydrogenase-like Zn-dependent dehydrogenase